VSNKSIQSAPASGDVHISAEQKQDARLPRGDERRHETDEKLKTFLNEKELLRRLPISRRTLFNWRMSGKIPAIVIGRRVLFCWNNVAEALRRLESGGCQ